GGFAGEQRQGGLGVCGGGDGSLVAGGDPLEHLGPVDAHVPGRVDADAYPVAASGGHDGDDDVVAYEDAFALLASKYQHVVLLTVSGRGVLTAPRVKSRSAAYRAVPSSVSTSMVGRPSRS